MGWLAYMIFGVVSALFILPISCFPRYLPGTKDVRRAKLTSGELVVNHKRGEDTAFDLSQPGGGGGDSSPRPKSTLKHWAAAFSKQTISDVRSFALACKDTHPDASLQLSCPRHRELCRDLLCHVL